MLQYPQPWEVTCPASGAAGGLGAPRGRHVDPGHPTARAARGDPGPDPRLCASDRGGPYVGAGTHPGYRHSVNQDAFAIGQRLVAGSVVTALVVCDGVTSAHAAAEASQLAATHACTALLRGSAELPGDPLAAMSAAIRAAHEAVCSLDYSGRGHRDPPGTTLVGALLRGRDLTIGWVGDSRAYWVTPDTARQITRDHSWRNEAVDRGQLTVEQAALSPFAHALTHCLGQLEEVETGRPPVPGLARLVVPPNCQIILCTDGLWNYAPGAADLVALVRDVPLDVSAQALADYLVDAALERGGHDNVTVAVALVP